MNARVLLAGLALTAMAAPAMAANARHPYANIDRRIDAGNDTGDSQVDRLNDAQLDRNYYGRAPGGPGPGSPPPMGGPMGGPPPYYGR